MWQRNVFFLAICAALLAGFASSLFRKSPQPAMAAVDWDDVATSAARVDAAFAESWRDAGIEPAESAAELTVARRLSLALAGTIPSLEEIRRIERRDPREQVSGYLAELLADRRSSDYLAERLARATVGVEDGPFLLYRRRRFVSWLSDEVQANRPYDAIVRHLIADTGLWTDTPATNFITVAIHPDQAPEPDANQLAARVSRAFLGVRIDCAECHDHPFEPWKQRDFQGLAAFFAEARQSLRGVQDSPGRLRVENRQTGEITSVACQVPFAEELLGGEGPARQRLAEWVTSTENRSFAREAVNRAWAIMFGRALVEPLDDLGLAGPFPAALEVLADDFVAHDYDWRRLLVVIASTRVFRLDSTLDEVDLEQTRVRERVWAVFPLVRLRPEQVAGALLQSASLTTINAESSLLARLARSAGERDFIARYGDAGEDEFMASGGTIPQRLLLMNGELVAASTKDDLLGNSATKIAALAPDDARAIETTMLTVLSRRPTAEEIDFFRGRLSRAEGAARTRRVADLYWTLVNSSEFAWNH